MTLQQLEDLLICSHSPVYFAKKVLHTKKHDAFTIKQLNCLYSDANRIDMGDERQSRRTSTMLVRALWEALYRNGKMIMIVSDSNTSVMDAREKILRMLDVLPKYLKSDVIYNNRDCIEFNNGSRIIFATATKHNGRGLSIDLLVLDNMSLVDQKIYPMLMSNYCATSSRIIEAK